MSLNFFIQNAVIPFTAALAGNSGAKVLDPVLRVFDSWFYITFGSNMELRRQQKEIEQKAKLDNYELNLQEKQKKLKLENIGKLKNEIGSELLKIPKDKIVLPDKQSIAILMDNIPNYLDVDGVRKLFAKMMVASANQDFKYIVHPSFVETIKQLTPQDVDVINKLYTCTGFFITSDPKYISKEMRMEVGIQHKKKPKFVVYRENLEKNYSILIGEELDKVIKCDINEFDRQIMILSRLGIVSIERFNNKTKLSFIKTDEYDRAFKKALSNSDEFINYKKELDKSFEDLIVTFNLKIVEFTEFGSQIAKIINTDLTDLLIISTEMNDFAGEIIPVPVEDEI
ncbi:hypothetical protein C5L30_001248 [Companilactobacillus farciminis]|jgi:hypothetical protein|uniref:DUF4393 domain-containing protein n=1 Tax=Companilactobacillus farciminis TaxID=1612 RepID=A0A4R5NGU9_9LACO|nr:Abi-alpha family protein [Companilactobacillus farciminis]ATO45656.1 hypothetical protein LF20184_02280 [Companilactobacillus farciminis KCTC 3681 = DSM 20184]KRK61414.1 hypothetical protein FC68_GL001070 [Companilactobacillus farciminis KCTC 3681 = DSM 20184]TDG73756.1 hypothetical protein C5L30_001248 [Companilactobacillus farciminis]